MTAASLDSRAVGACVTAATPEPLQSSSALRVVKCSPFQRVNTPSSPITPTLFAAPGRSYCQDLWIKIYKQLPMGRLGGPFDELPLTKVALARGERGEPR